MPRIFAANPPLGAVGVLPAIACAHVAKANPICWRAAPTARGDGGADGAGRGGRLIGQVLVESEPSALIGGTGRPLGPEDDAP